MCGEVELATLNKKLLGRQHKHYDIFLLFFYLLVSFKFIPFYLVIVLIIFCLFDPGLSIFVLNFKFLEVLKLEH